MNTIHVYNTLTKTQEEFSPLIPEKVSLYHCGPTVYWNQHIGNMRSVVIGDVIRRTFIYAGYEASYVRNYTDVGHLTGDNIGDADTGEDRMEKAAAREGLNPDEIAQKYIDAYLQDITLLNTLPATHTPRATEYIDQMIQMVQTLIEKGFAYVTPLAVYIDISRVPEYNKLSKQDISKLISGTGHGEAADSNKRNPGDFSVWFFRTGAHANALQYWPSPFHSELVENGNGFPGWHIECSAMIKALLGTTIDIHIGGIEHIPIHHTNEIAQSESCNGEPLARYWLHNEHLLVNNGKMSKSEGTSYLVSDITQRGFDPLALRYFFLQAHYRSQQNFTWEALEAAQKALHRLYRAVAEFPQNGRASDDYMEKFNAAIFDDFNTSSAMAVIYEVMSSNLSPGNKRATILAMDQVFGLGFDNANRVNIHIEVTDDVQRLLEDRENARAGKQWEQSDRLRDKIRELGYHVKDTEDGQIVSKLQ